MPRPESATSITADWPSTAVVTARRPWPSMASTAFFIRFSITHSSSGALRLTVSGSDHSDTLNSTADEMRLLI